MFLKKLPIIGAVAGTIFALQRVLEGDFIGAGLELGSGILVLLDWHQHLLHLMDTYLLEILI